MKQAGIIGWPVNHSLSPRLHNYWLKQYGIKGRYDSLAVAPGDLEAALRALPQRGFAGVNITLPHKEKALFIVDEPDAIARRIGAVNTVIVQGRKLLGTNTDAYGFSESLKTQTKDMPPGKALVLGAGGAARAVVSSLMDDGWEVVIAARTLSKAETIIAKAHPGAGMVGWDKMNDAMPGCALLVNTTSLGMKGQKPLALNLDPLPESAFVCDIVYNPLMTLFLTQARARGNPVITGLGMLLYQGQAAFEAWFGVKPEVNDVLYRHMAEAIA